MAEAPILYSFRRCPYAIRARLALLASGTVCEIREVKLSAKPAELRAASLKATVPVLLLPDGRAIDQSLDIMRWALARHDPDGWLGRIDDALIAVNDGTFKHHLDRTKYPGRHADDATDHRAAAAALLLPLEHRLAAAPHLHGATPGFTDAAVMPFVRQFAEIDRAWFEAQPLPGIQAWLRRQLESPLFEATMIRLAPWRPGDLAVHFGGAASGPNTALPH